ncbi:MAG: Pyruvate kinase [Candidatus Kaiserbacteria bacterium GW2011_GWC2_52_8b]|uniref:pyruvate kinase n=1 Tax=Candidatus Kaiserbacteria bacterium GW2011_GWC2_52_8b TaxID=1618676 RepID=A0A0G2ABU6_9BACT|nr:MAG: Pyruvate kinase [Candidatus Kaiserbacteria bacterium GW2011_GWC2_52_8b]
MQSRTQIIATIGPASGTPEILDKLIAAGMDVARINFSHGTHETDGSYIKNIRAAAERAGKRIPIIQDLAGPRKTTDTGHAFDKSGSVITEKDISDLAFGIECKVDYIAQSYVGNAADIEAMHTEITKRGGNQKLIAKIERPADAIMVARGDLGQALPIEELPFVERDIIARTKRVGKPVIVATQMMLSMMHSDAPTRAEVTDVAYAVILSADAVMLSEESALGAHPVEVVTIMERIVTRAERENRENTFRPL